MALGSQHIELNAQERYRLVFWNVENLFDIWDDSISNDDAFTPTGENHWNSSRYKSKTDNIYKTIVAIGGDTQKEFNMPLLIGMAEVENDKVLRDLCKGTPLRRLGYAYVHFDSPDRRGIDNALLYREKNFNPFWTQTIGVSDSAAGFFTRDILLVEGSTPTGDTIIVLVNHFPSRRGGAEADRQRRRVAQTLRHTMDTLIDHHPCTAIVVMGDFNATPEDPAISKELMSGEGYVNLSEKTEPGIGSYKYQGEWSCIDQIIVSKSVLLPSPCVRLTVADEVPHIFQHQSLLEADEKYMGSKPKRTYIAMKYHGGVSDHLPIYIDLVRGE